MVYKRGKKFIKIIAVLRICYAAFATPDESD